ncbi:hypothetical protein LUD75_07325 [Epilithonimonas sp. JDS]|nr:hypothetical protein [Epilithonimonas sp. JDS]MCD9854511.1 hypothetical protein [Epilithonimonas sp. JDS]
MEFYKGSSIDNNGKRIHLREFEYLKMYLIAEPKNPKEKKENKETLELAENILAIRKTFFPFLQKGEKLIALTEFSKYNNQILLYYGFN